MCVPLQTGSTVPPVTQSKTRARGRVAVGAWAPPGASRWTGRCGSAGAPVGSAHAPPPRSLLASIAAGLALPGMASAAVFCVPNLAVAPDCGTARATVGVAVNDAVAQSGEDTVRIGAGSFTPFTAVSSSDLTTIVGAGIDQTFVEGSGNITIVSLSGSFALKNLTVRRTTGTGLPVASLQTTYAENVAFARTGGNGDVVDYNSDPPSGGPALKNVTITSAAGTSGDFALSAFNMSADGLTVDTTGPGDAVSGNGLTLKHMKVVARNPIAAVSLYATSSITDSLILATGATAEGCGSAPMVRRPP